MHEFYIKITGNADEDHEDPRMGGNKFSLAG